MDLRWFHFAFWGLFIVGLFLLPELVSKGTLRTIIFANYLSWLPGSPDTLWLFVGLGGILGGIITATQYR